MQLRRQLEQAETIIEIQNKVAGILGKQTDPILRSRLS